MLWGITCSCFLLEQNYGKNGGKWIPSSGCKRWILWGLAHCKRLLSQRAPHIFPSGFYMDMGWELNYVWNNIRPGHETFNSLHPIFSFLKKVPPLTEQKEQEMCDSMMPVDPCLTVAPCPYLFHSAVGTSQVHCLLCFAAKRVKAQAVFHCCSQVLPLTSVCWRKC